MDSHGDPARFLVAAGAVADCSVAGEPTGGPARGFLLAGRGRDTGAAVSLAGATGAGPAIPPESNGKVKRPYDRRVYRQGHLVENAFVRLERWRGIAMRHAKRPGSFVAAVQARCISLWLHIL